MVREKHESRGRMKREPGYISRVANLHAPVKGNFFREYEPIRVLNSD